MSDIDGIEVLTRALHAARADGQVSDLEVAAAEQALDDLLEERDELMDMLDEVLNTDDEEPLERAEQLLARLADKDRSGPEDAAPPAGDGGPT